ncbi:MAG: reprolysin-like metallopeptidase [Flavobacteriaceae bacterium]
MRRFLMLTLVFLMTWNSHAQKKGQWSLQVKEGTSLEKYSRNRTLPERYVVFHLEKAPELEEDQEISLPMPDGRLSDFVIERHDVLSTELSAKYPEIQSYRGYLRADPEHQIFISKGRDGFFGMGFSPGQGQYFFDPIDGLENDFIVYKKSDLPASSLDFLCEVGSLSGKAASSEVHVSARQNSDLSARGAGDGQLRTFRLAVATTAEYSNFHLNNQSVSASASESEKKEAVLSAINTTMTRVNGIFERDVALTMELVAGNDELIFFDAATDGLSNFDAGDLIDESQEVIDEVIGYDNYDIGHTFSTGGGGLAMLRSPCTTNKAMGITGSSYPLGDAYDVDFVAHEMGHQFGATHTFNGTDGSCSGNKTVSTAVEPGSGSTIMSYAGLCSGINVQNLADSYFHTVSIAQMVDNTYSGNSDCGALSSLGNQAPVADAGTDYVMPISTPFILSGFASDADSENLTYSWEQIDNGTASAPPSSDDVAGPVFRSYAPVEESWRSFPVQSAVLSGENGAQWEVLPSVWRDLNFAFTVRDNHPGGGQSDVDYTLISVIEEAGPFEISSWNSSGEVLEGGTSVELTWEVAGTDQAPIGVEFLDLWVSYDNGVSFELYQEKLVNNGVYDMIVPNVDSDGFRVMLKAVDHIFYDINNHAVQVQRSDFSFEFVERDLEVCLPGDAVYELTYSAAEGFGSEVSLSVSGLPEGAQASISPEVVQTDATAVEIVISGLNTEMIGTYNLEFLGVDASSSQEKIVDLSLRVLNAELDSQLLVSPEQDEVTEGLSVMFSWETQENATEYLLEVSKSSDLSNPVLSQIFTGASYVYEGLESDQTYYWRVSPSNLCGTGASSEVASFQSANIVEEKAEYSGGDLSIPDSDSKGISAVVRVVNDFVINDVNVGVEITHPWAGDISLVLISPSGTSVDLIYQNALDSGDNFEQTVFDDQASVSIGLASAPFTGSFRPQESLSNFNEELSKGDWVLRVVDEASGDLGVLTGFYVALSGVVNDDVDGDGVLNSEDNCPYVANSDQLDSDGDGIGDVCEEDSGGIDLDTDLDGVADNIDNCPLSYNPDQADFDFDGIGDVCDDDIDGDGVPDLIDNCPRTFNDDQLDIDGDGIGDVCDSDISMDIAIPNGLSPNGDGLNDVWDLSVLSVVYQSVEVFIYSSSGELLFHDQDYQNNWSGQRNVGVSGPLEVGSYYYVIRANQAISSIYLQELSLSDWVYLNY